MWQSILNAIDAVESWLVLLPLIIQIPLLLVVLVPICWFAARAVDVVVDWGLDRVDRARARRE
jgi:hypothetical protein